MPLVDYGCYDCGEVTERLIKDRYQIPGAVACSHCGASNTVKLAPLVNFKMYRPPKYGEEFMEKAMPALKSKKELAPHFSEGKGSEEGKMFQMSEAIGERIDGVLHKNFPVK